MKILCDGGGKNAINVADVIKIMVLGGQLKIVQCNFQSSRIPQLRSRIS